MSHPVSCRRRAPWVARSGADPSELSRRLEIAAGRRAREGEDTGRRRTEKRTTPIFVPGRPSMSFRARPATVLSCLALFFALGGSALAVSHAVKPQPRCANGAVRGIAAVTGESGKGMANLPDVPSRARRPCSRAPSTARVARCRYDAWVLASTRCSSPATAPQAQSSARGDALSWVQPPARQRIPGRASRPGRADSIEAPVRRRRRLGGAVSSGRSAAQSATTSATEEWRRTGEPLGSRRREPRARPPAARRTSCVLPRAPIPSPPSPRHLASQSSSLEGS